MCDSCDYNKEDIHNNALDICSDCRDYDDDDDASKKLITKSDAMEKYALTNKDLKGTRHIMNEGKYVYYLYLVEDVKNIAIDKYGSLDDMIKKIQEKQGMRIKRKNEKKKLEQIRRDELTAYLKSVGLDGIRSDSEICSEYISKGEKSGYTKEKIADIMLEMKFYHTCTSYPTVLRNRRYNMKRDMGYYDWSSEDEECLRVQVKEAMFKDYIEKNYNNTQKIGLEVPPSLYE